MMLGRLLIITSNHFSRQEVTNFCNRIVATKAAKETPILLLDGVSFVHHTHNDITLLATTKSNANAALLMQFLYAMVTLCKSYFNGEFGEEQVRKNFSLIYELLDEVMDFGYPQILDPDLLKMYITQGKQANPNLNVSLLIYIIDRILRNSNRLLFRPLVPYHGEQKASDTKEMRCLLTLSKMWMYFSQSEALFLSLMWLVRFSWRLNSVGCLNANLELMTNFLSRMQTLPSRTEVFK